MATPISRVWKASRTATSGMVLNEDSVLMIGTKDNMIAVDDAGVTISGPISLVAEAHNIRRGGLFVGLNDFTDMIPSTIITPLPKQIPLPPIQGVINLAKDVAFFTSLLI